MTSSSAELHLNDPVSITTSTTNDEDNEQLHGIIAHLGPVEFAPDSDWVGIQLTGLSVGKGEHDGSVDGVVYFDAGGARNGMFVKRVNVRILSEASSTAALKERTVGSSLESPPVDDTRTSNRVSSENILERALNPDSGTSLDLNEKDSTGSFQSDAPSLSSLSSVARNRSRESAPSFDDKTRSARATAYRENFLRQLELEQKQKQSDGENISGEKKSKAKSVSFVGMADSEATSLLEETATKKEMKPIEEAEPKSSLLEEGSTINYKGDDNGGEKESIQSTSNIPRGNPNDDMTTVMSYLSSQSNLTHDQSSLDWISDLDASSFMFLKGLASGHTSSNHSGYDFSGPSAWNVGRTSSQPSDSVSPSSSVGEVPLSTTQSDIIPEGSFQRASDEVLKGRKIVKVTSPESLSKARLAPPNDVPSIATCPEQPTPIEHRMLTMIEKQYNQIQELQARLDALGNIMSQMSNDVRYLCESQRRRDQDQGSMTENVTGYRLTGFVGNERAGRIPPPPPPLPPMRQGETATAATMVTQTPPNQQPPAMGRLGGGRPFNRGFFFPLATYVAECIVSFVRNFRSILLSTGPGRVYTHIRNEAIRRRAFANIDLMSLMKLMVMLLVFSGRMGRDGEGNRNRRGGARRAQDNNEGGEEGMAALVAGLMHTAIAFVRAHRVHVLVIASLIGFLIQTGLMSFFYEVFWIEREELLRVWLGRRDQAEDRVDDNSELEGIIRADGLEQNMNAEQGANRQAVPARARAGPNANRVRDILRHGRDNRQANVNRRAGGMIRRAPDGGFLHDIQCLVFSFILSLIPAWKPEEAAPRPGIQQGQQEMQQGADDPAEDEDAH
ncbi:hypothetical protein HJC23_013039 [Cyclotella cryptica]|uniref:CAP-Gly domain-containing protein n=1 Tax=Cyclotella cryptica TaxID=29204 RepID=A0ABD3QG23_9STRA|eukprot:CCRYP_005659-RA/>CCRYP_005659-RA protein AED:0.24 eAED:0.24 QI:60/1/1/1/0/0/2/1797/841